MDDGQQFCSLGRDGLNLHTATAGGEGPGPGLAGLNEVILISKPVFL